MSTQQWEPVDQTVPVAASDVSSFDRAEQAAMDLARLVMAAPGAMQQMRLYEAGAGPRMQPWCLAHDQPPAKCDGDGCDIALPPGHADPTGQAATIEDRAAADRKELGRIFESIGSLVRKGTTMVDRYPSEAFVPEEAKDDGPGDGWCLNCYRDGQYFEPVGMQKRHPTEDDPRTEVPYYVDRCKWCGDMRAAHGFDPPPHLANLHHRHVRITAGMWAEEKDRRQSQKAKNKKGKKTKANTRRRWEAEDLTHPPRITTPSREDA